MKWRDVLAALKKAALNLLRKVAQRGKEDA